MLARKERKNPWACEKTKANHLNYNFWGKYKEDIRKNMSSRSNHEVSGKTEKQDHLPIAFCHRLSECSVRRTIQYKDRNIDNYINVLSLIL